MSRQELVDAYLEGRISRRTMVRRLTALGISAAAAVSYAEALAPERAHGAPTVGDTLYPLVGLQVKSRKVAKVASSGKLKVRLSCGEELETVQFSAFLKKGKGLVSLGRATVAKPLASAGERNFTIAVNKAPLQGKRRATVVVWAHTADAEEYPGFVSAVGKLK